MNHKLRGSTFSKLFVIASLSFFTSAHAELEEIVVTAQKRQESVQDVGIAITALSTADIQNLGITNSVTDLALAVPGVNFSSSNGGQFVQFSIRGVTQVDASDHTEAPNAVYIDEGYIASPQGQSFAMYDLERVEVLKGPQGTLFGRNATGGLVRYITNKPGQEFEAFGDLSYGEYNLVRFEGAVSGPITDTFSGRISAFVRRHDDVVENVFPLGQIANPITGELMGPSSEGATDLRNDDQWSVRVQGLWEPNDRLSVLASGYYYKQEVSAGQYNIEAVAPVFDNRGRMVNAVATAGLSDNQGFCEAISAETGQCLPIALVDFEGLPGGPAEDARRPFKDGDLLGFRDPMIALGSDEFVQSAEFSPREDVNQYEVYGGTVTAAWDLDAFTLHSISHALIFDKRTALDEGGAVPWLLGLLPAQHDTASQEIRLEGTIDDRTRWIGGFYFLYIDADVQGGLGLPDDSPLTFTLGPLVTGTQLAFIPASFYELTTRSYSVFGQIDFDITDRLTFTGGLRTIREEKDFDFEMHMVRELREGRISPPEFAFPPGLIPPFPPVSAESRDTLWAAKGGLNYHLTDEIMFYATLSRGVKAGGFTAPLFNFGAPLPAEDFPYEPEVLYAYEGGVKATLFDGSLRVNATAYYYDYDGYQATRFETASSRVVNTDAQFRGFEFDVIAQPPMVDGLTVQVGGSFIDATVNNLQIGEGLTRDVQPSFTPPLQFAGLIRQEFPGAIFGGSVGVQLDGNYSSYSYANLQNFSSQKLPANGSANARVFWEDAQGNWKVTFFVKNLSNERNRVNNIDLSTLCGCQEVGFADPRWFGGSVRYEY